MKKYGFVNLHTHTDLSKGDGYATAQEYCDRAEKLGQTALAITEHGNLSSIPAFLKAAKFNSLGEPRKNPIKPIIGLEGYFYFSRKLKKPEVAWKHQHIILLAYNLQGYKNLVEINNKSFDLDKAFYYKPRIDWELLSLYNEGLIVLSSCLGGILGKPFAQDNKEEIPRIIKRMQDIFGDRFFLELQMHDLKEQRRYNKFLLELHDELNISLVITSDAHYTKKTHKRYRDLTTSIDRISSLNKNGETGIGYEDNIDNLFLYSEEELWEERKKHRYINKETFKEAIKNTSRIAKLVEEYDPRHDFSLPQIPNAKQTLIDICKENIKTLVPKKDRKEYIKRFKYEFKVIKDKNYIDYFMIVYDIVSWAKKQNILIGPGRGSASGSLISYLLGITKLDPIKFGLMFERFITQERTEPPDIDIDIADRDRALVTRYFCDKYRGIPIATYSQNHTLGLVRDLVRIHGLDKDKKIKYPVPWEVKQDNTLEENMESSKELRKIIRKFPKLKKEIIKLENRTRHVSRHASGFVISNPLLPIIKTKEELSAAWSDGVEVRDLSEMGHIKFDFLGLATLTMLQKCLKDLGKTEEFLYDIPLDNERTLVNFKLGNNKGIFQFDSWNGIKLTKAVKPRKFSDLVAINSLNRPGPLDAGMDDIFIGRRRGDLKWNEKNKIIKRILKDTYGVIIYQEQIMLLLSDLGSIPLNETENFRKDLIKLGKSTKKVQKEKIKAYKNSIVNAFVSNGLNEKKAKRLWDEIVTFARYGFNLSHSTCYSLLGYWQMYFKVHYPEVFYAAAISMEQQSSNRQKGETRAKELIQEAGDIRIKILKPDINKSKEHCTPGKKVIRLGLNGIKTLGEKGVIEIIDKQPFSDYNNFNNKVEKRKVNIKAIEALKKAGAFRKLKGYKEDE